MHSYSIEVGSAMLTAVLWRRIFLYRPCCDLRRSFDRLAAIVQEQMQQDPLNGDLYIFINRRRTMLKALYWDRDGYALWQKRLERGRFELSSGSGNELQRLELVHMLEGVRVSGIKRLKRYQRINTNV